ncbi:hypothetical protein MKK84_06880, partial [Methylobacterium sp. E-065]|nr:hypothetical protein [Methylobacterium sp. E-065]
SGGVVLVGGTLSVARDANLGAPSGPLAFDGGTLQITGTAFATTARPTLRGPDGRAVPRTLARPAGSGRWSKP